MDTVGQFLTLIRNAGAAKHDKVDVPFSKLREGIAKILQEEGRIRSFRVAKDSRQGVMRVHLKYNEDGSHAITKVARVSRPGRRTYMKADELPIVRSGLGFGVVSTNQGVLSTRVAKEKNLGGEFLCTVW